MAAPENSSGTLPADLHVLIMAGGSGTRFWPRSRAKKPKQLLALWDDKTLIEHTVSRFTRHLPASNIWIVTTEALVKPTREILDPNYPQVRYLGEPAAKNTAACILWGIREISRVNPSALIAVMPADHFIGDLDSFVDALDAAVTDARSSGSIVTLGIKPNRPETGYGYIEVAESRPAANKPLAVKAFVEKPDLRTAARYIESGRYLWNAGMFIFTAKTGLEAFNRTMPELCQTFGEGTINVADVYAKIRKEDAVSVDYGVMEPATSKGIAITTVPADCGWNDVGSFPALEEINRATRGEVVSIGSHSNVVQTDEGIVALLGVNDLVVVREADVVLVAAKDRAQDIKQLLEKVKLRFPEKI